MDILIIGIALIAIGVVIKLYIGRRAFNRRNEAGVEGFRSYGSAVGSALFEKILNIIAVTGVIIGVILSILYLVS